MNGLELMSKSGNTKEFIRLFIADDHPIVRERIKRLVQECDDMELVGEAAHCSDLLSLLRHNRVDVLLLDISMPGPSFLETLKQLNGSFPGIRVLVVSMQPEKVYASRALLAGAAGYLAKDRSAQELARAVRTVHQGDLYLSEEIAENLTVDTARSTTKEISSSRTSGM